LSIKVPVRVRGRETTGSAWEEVASSLDASEGGLAIVMSRAVRPGQVLHLSVPLPPRFRRHDIAASFYRVYALVRGSRGLDSRSRVAVMFLGPNPPQGSDPLPSELYRLPGEREPDAARFLLLRLEAAEAPGCVAVQENAVIERLTGTTAVVRVTSLPVGRGTILTVEEIGGSFKARAEVTVISIDERGHARLVLSIVNTTVPDRLLAQEAAAPTA
jgi:hypothetical protein